MSRAEFDKINKQLDDGDIDDEDLFESLGFDMTDPCGWDDPELGDFFPSDKEVAA